MQTDTMYLNVTNYAKVNTGVIVRRASRNTPALTEPNLCAVHTIIPEHENRRAALPLAPLAAK